MNGYSRLQCVAVLGTLLVGIGAVVRENMPAKAGARTAVSSPVRAAPAQILVNAQGMTLYLFTSDKKNQSNCTGQCATYWPPVLLSSGTRAPSAIPGINGTFGVAARADGSKQLTFNGSPLYTFVKDRKPGDITGQGVGGTWWAALVSRSAPQAAQSTPGDDNGHHDDHGHNRGGSSASATPTPAGSYYNGSHGGDG